MTWQRVSPILVSLCVLVFISIVSQRSRMLAGLVSAMPVLLTLGMWIYYTSSGAGHPGLTEFVGAQLRGVIGAAGFVLVCYVTISHRWSFVLSVAAGYAAWFILVLGGPWVIRGAQRAIQLLSR